MDFTTKTRLKTAIIAASVVFPILVWGGVSGLFVLAAFAFVIGCSELAAMFFSSDSKKEQRNAATQWIVAGIFWVIFLSMENVISESFHLAVGLISISLFLFYFMSGIAFWIHSTEDSHEFIQAGGMPVGWLWLILGLSCTFYIRTRYQGLAWLWYFLCTVWLTDIGAYFFGRAWGNKKMAPTISQGKTWVGTFGGIATAMLGGTMFGHFVGLNISFAILLSLSLMVSVLAVIGDLYESLIKRACGVKDSGTLLPGHGGVLDRLDSILYASPFLAGMLALIS